MVLWHMVHNCDPVKMVIVDNTTGGDKQIPNVTTKKQDNPKALCRFCVKTRPFGRLTKFLHGGPPSLGPSQPTDVEDGGRYSCHLDTPPPHPPFTYSSSNCTTSGEKQNKQNVSVNSNGKGAI